MSMYREIRKKEGIVTGMPEFGYAGEVPVLRFTAVVRNDMQTEHTLGKEFTGVRYCLRGEMAEKARNEGVISRGVHISHDNALMNITVMENMLGKKVSVFSCYPKELTVSKDGKTFRF